MPRISTGLVTVVNAAAVLGWTWPNGKLERLDTLRFDQFATNQGMSLLGLASRGCTEGIFGTNNSVRTNAADWFRTAYHDMATFNITDGTGGLDGSIRFSVEQGRAENVGDGFSNTVSVIGTTPTVDRFTSVADAVALGAVFAVEQCGGPQIDFKGGRVDALAPNNPGVPEPQQSLAEHTAAFKRQGFSATDMIGLVACGHTLGGVQSKSFPNIVPASTIAVGNSDGDALFDTTGSIAFDNKIASEYISGTTKNPLIVTANATLRSDARIFGSDGNTTMKAFASNPATFQSTCATLIARMLNTVPKGVTLSEVLAPPPAKPDAVTFVYNSDGTYSLLGRVRFWSMAENPNRVVNLVWANQGQTTKCSGCSVALTHTPPDGNGNPGDVSLFTPGSHTSLFYNFPPTGAIITSSVGSAPQFWFESTENGVTTKFNQNGPGFQLQTQVLLASTTCLTSSGMRVDIAVRKGSNPSRVFLQGGFPQPLSGNSEDFKVGLTNIALATKNTAASALDTRYDIYTVTLDGTTAPINFQTLVNVAATIGGKDVADVTYFGQNPSGAQPYQANLLRSC